MTLLFVLVLKNRPDEDESSDGASDESAPGVEVRATSRKLQPIKLTGTLASLPLGLGQPWLFLQNLGESLTSV